MTVREPLRRPIRCNSETDSKVWMIEDAIKIVIAGSAFFAEPFYAYIRIWLVAFQDAGALAILLA